MKRTVTLILIFALSMILVSCQNEADNPPDMHGYVIEKDEYQILVINKEAYDFSDTGGIDNFYEAMFLRNPPNELEVGHEVYVWIDGPVEESYPSRASIGDYEIVDVKEPVSANLTTKEAVQNALEELGEGNWVAITDVQFDEESKKWRVTYVSIFAMEDEEKEPRLIEVSDE